MTSTSRCPPILLLLSTIVLFEISLLLVFPVLPFIVARSVPDAGQQGAVIGLLALLAFFGLPVLGALSDAFGRRPVILLGSAAGCLLFGTGGSLAMLFLGRASAPRRALAPGHRWGRYRGP